MNGGAKILAALIIGIIIGGGMVYAYERMKPITVSVNPDAQQQINDSAAKMQDEITAAASVAAQVATSEWTIPLNEQNHSGSAGFATLRDKNGQVEVLVALANAPGASAAATPHPIHIHLGACPNPGAVKFPLNDIVNGTSDTMLPTSIAQLKTMLPLAINAHLSASKINQYIACGDLK